MIYGRVLDPTGAAVAGAAVVVTNTNTGTSVKIASNETGYYEAALLLPGDYQVSVEASGFRTAVRRGIVLPLGTRTEVDIRLELGALTETVQVTAVAPMLDTSGVSSGRVVDNRSILDLPVSRSTTMLLVRLVPGIQATNSVRAIGPESTQSGSEYSAAGNVGGNEWSIDGAPNNGRGKATTSSFVKRFTAYMPHSDTIQEFKVDTSAFDASIGHTTGVVISMMSKTGGNQLHGSLSELHTEKRWNAAPFFVSKLYYQRIAAAEAAGDTALVNKLRSEPKQPSGHDNNYAATIGGPVVLPRIYNGKDRLFFFFSFNGYKNVSTEDPDAINRTVPTLANRNGDFSQLLSVGARYQIYDPLSVRSDPARAGHFVRDPIAGNVLPKSRIINPIYGAYAKFYPAPNNDPADPRLEPLNNFLAVSTPNTRDYKVFTNRIDYQHSNRHRFFGRWSWNDYYENLHDFTYETVPGLNANGLYRRNMGGTADWVFTPSSSTVIDASIAANEFMEGNKGPVLLDYKPSDVGLPTYLDARAGDRHTLPQVRVSGYETMPSSSYPTFARFRMITGKVDVSHIRANHTMRAGFDSRHHFQTGGGGGNTSGRFDFTNAFTRKNDDTFTPAGDLGLSWAAFMMGFPSSLQIASNDSYATHSPYYAWYVQDAWRVTPRLTLNFGFRVEYEQGATERYNRALGYFDRNAVLPITDAAQAAYAKNPLPELAASGFTVRGGSVYAGAGGSGRRLYRNELMWMPRFAVVGQVNSRTVLRGGYGMFYDTLNVLNFDPDQTGYSRTTSTNPTNDFGVTWLAGDPRNGVSVMSDPFPVRKDGTRFDEPVRNSLGLMARAGRGWTFMDFDTKHARQHRWRLGLQRQFGANTVIEAAYAGSYSDRVYVNRLLSALPEQYWASGLTRNDAIANDLNRNVTNPFHLSNFSSMQTSSPVIYQDMSTQGFYTSSTIRKHQLLRPFPHMNGLTQTFAPFGEVRTDALEISLDRRFSKGFNLNIGYTLLRANNADIYLNEFDSTPTWRPSNSAGRPHRLVATGIFELPFGKGRPLAKTGLPSVLFGGFQVGLTYEFSPGPLLDFGNLFYYGNLDDITKGERTLDRWFNTDGFERNAAKAPAAFHRRVFPTRVEGLRGDLTNIWNGNAIREFRFRERGVLQFRFDALNLMNRTQFQDPNVNPLSTNFGKVTAQSNTDKRTIQLQLRLRF